VSTPTESSKALPAPAPTVTPETKPFWDATAQGRLLLAKCPSCEEVLWYPKAFCSKCATTEVAWIEASGRGTVYSFTIARRATHAGVSDHRDPYGESTNFVLALVELAEGPRMFTNIVECDPESVEIDQEVELIFADTGEGSALPRFRPVRPQG
jgi:uncharacterized OB-fold protein